MQATSVSYLLGSEEREIERLRVQAEVFAPDARRLFEHLGLARGAHAVDLGCGAHGTLLEIAERVGPEGRAVGVDADARQLAAGRRALDERGLGFARLVLADALASGLPRASFDLVHARFLLAPTGREREVLAEMRALAKPGAWIALQEPDTASWRFEPGSRAFERLKELVLAAFRRHGDLDAGRGLAERLRASGLEQVGTRSSVHRLPPGHPYRRVPVEFGRSLRPVLFAAGLCEPDELEELLREVEALAMDPARAAWTFTLVQAFGRVPA